MGNRVKADKNISALALKYFGGLYFSYEQAAKLDAILHLIPSEDERVRDCIKSAVLSTASDLVNTVGKQFAQPIRPRDKSGEPKQHLIRQIQRDRSLDSFLLFEVWLEKYGSLKPTGRTSGGL